MSIEFNGFSNIVSQIPTVLKWLSSYGINVNNSRYAKYEQIINDYFNNKDLEKYLLDKDLNSIELNQKLKDKTSEKFLFMTEALKEVFEIVIIYKTLYTETNNVFLKERLHKIIKGKTLIKNGENSPTNPRDILFELVIISYFCNLNYKVNFNVMTDVVVENSELKVFGECKRLSSEKNLQKQLSKAKKQLQKIDFKNNEYGLIFIDISNCIYENFINTELQNAENARNLLDYFVNNFITRNEKVINEYNDKCINFSLGICIFVNMPTWTQDGTLYRNIKIQVVAPEKLSTYKFQKLNNIFNGFDSTLEKLFV